jgi:hypothetical protein
VLQGPREVPELKVRERPHQRENVDGGPPGGAKAEGPRAPTINIKTSTAGPLGGAGAEGLGAPTINVKTSTTVPREVPKLKVQERPHQRENVDGRPLGGAGVEGPGASTINVKTSTAGPREVPELEI